MHVLLLVLLLILLIVHQHYHMCSVDVSLHHLQVLLLYCLIRLSPAAVVHEEAIVVLSWGKAIRRISIVG